jgi:hypothetical protein
MQRCLKVLEDIKASGVLKYTTEPLLKLFVSLNRKPMSLADHFPFEPMYSTDLPDVQLWVTARQLSKCLDEEDPVELSNGQMVPLKEILVGDQVVCMDQNGKRVVGRVSRVYRSGVKDVWEVKTRLGTVLRPTKDHRFFTMDGYVPLERLKVGDRVASFRRGGVFGTKKLPRNRIALTAYLLGDGSSAYTYAISFTTACEEVKREFHALASAVQPNDVLWYPKEDSTAETGKVSAESQIRYWLEQDGAIGKRAWDKVIPDWAYDLPKKDLQLFISKLWATDGEINLTRDTPSIKYSSTSSLLADGVKALLRKFGIPSSRYRRPSYCHTKDGRKVRGRDCFVVRVETRQGWARFFKLFDVPGKPPVPIPDTPSNHNRDTIPKSVTKLIRQTAAALGLVRSKKGGTLYEVGLRLTPEYAMTREKLERYLTFFEKHAERLKGCESWEKLQQLAEEDLYWDQVVSIKRLGKRPTRDIEVYKHHNFSANGLVVHNSTNQSGSGILRSITYSPFRTLYITPLFEQIRKFSANYVRPMVEDSPMRNFIMEEGRSGSIVERRFANGSLMTFGYALLSCDRLRGIPADALGIDEIQDFNWDFRDIIARSMDASKMAVQILTGTPKTLDNGITSRGWDHSSQGRWAIKCGCGKENICAVDYDLLNMIGPPRDDISRERPGVICARCGGSISPRDGYYLHRFPDRIKTFVGRHVPQIIMPMHCEDPRKWGRIVAQSKALNQQTFYNEILGEPFDSAMKLVTETDLRAAARLGFPPDSSKLESLRDRYIYRVVAIDWGGYGEKHTSFTVYACLGITPSGRIEVVYGYRSLHQGDPETEAQIGLDLAKLFKAHRIVHDAGGNVGYLREAMFVQARFPANRIVPIIYRPPGMGNILVKKDPTAATGRQYYTLDKTRSLALVCQQIRSGGIQFFNYDYVDADNPGLLHDFLALLENRIERPGSLDVYLIVRDPLKPDDFAQAVNIGAVTLWELAEAYPNALSAKFEIDSQYLAALLEPDHPDWSEHYESGGFGQSDLYG